MKTFLAGVVLAALMASPLAHVECGPEEAGLCSTAPGFCPDYHGGNGG